MMDEHANSVNVWRVSLGNLYYVQGLCRNYLDPKAFHYSYEFTPLKEVAWLFPFEQSATNIAKVCGGIIEKVQVTHEEFLKLQMLRDYYFSESEINWLENQDTIIESKKGGV